jgi:hypothetical protein
VVNIDEPCVFYPAFEVLAWCARTPHLVTGIVEDFAESEDVVAFFGGIVLAIGMGIEVLEFHPTSRLCLSEIAVSRISWRMVAGQASSAWVRIRELETMAGPTHS